MESILDLGDRLAFWWDRWLWEPPAEQKSRWIGIPENLLRHLIRLTWLTLDRYRAFRLSTHASGLAFFLLLSLVPLLAFLFLILRIFQITDLVRPYLLRIVSGGNLQLVDQISTIIEQTQTGKLGVVGIMTLFVVGFMVLRRVKATLNMIWQVERPPSYRTQIVEYVAILVIAPFLLVVTFSLTTFLEGMSQVSAMAGYEAFGLSGLTLTRLSGYLVMWLLVFYAYAFLPDTRVSFMGAFVGALVAGSLLRLVESIYLVTLFKVVNYDMVYGALAALPFMMIWFHLAWTVFLLGSQLSFVLQNYAMAVERHRASGQFISTTPFAVVSVLVAIIRHMEETGSAPGRREIRSRSGLPHGVVADVIQRLESAELITPVVDQPRRLVPQEVLTAKTVRQVLERVNMMPRFSEPPSGWGVHVGGPLMKLLREAGEDLANRLEGMTLGELARQASP